MEWATTASLALLYDIKSQQRLMSAELLAAAQALFLAALRLLRNGLDADPLLKALGIRWRLSDAVLMNTALGCGDENCESAFALEGVIPGKSARKNPIKAILFQALPRMTSQSNIDGIITIMKTRLSTVSTWICISGELLKTLQRGFADGQHYWSEHKYSDPDTPFFSYLASDLVNPNMRCSLMCCLGFNPWGIG